MSAIPEFEAVIGLEVHCQLATESKIFCSCRARSVDGKSVADVASNSATCPVCSGQPGSLPVLNRKVVEYAIKAGLATGCRINLRNIFARKNYFYPDLPKGYQISQLELPICENGFLNIETSRGAKKVVIQRIHMEEDAGKNVHLNGYSLVNLNRAGVPLVEIVTGPDMSSAEEAGAYLRSLYAIVTSLGICDGNLQEGNFRCDANVSVMPKGSKQLGTRAEIKNVNSFRFVEKAIEFEISRQIDLISSGGRVVQETRLYDSDKNVTVSMRSKEEAQDYRYFPDPDLMPVILEASYVEKIRSSLPERPEQKKSRYIRDFELADHDAGLLAGSKEMSDFFEKVISLLPNGKSLGKPTANWINGELTRFLNEENIGVAQAKVSFNHIADLVRLVHASVLSNSAAKQVFAIAWKTGEAVEVIVAREGLTQVSDLSSLEPVIDKIIAASPSQVAEFRAGKEKILGFFVGQVMKETGGKANPGMIQEMIRKKLSS